MMFGITKMNICHDKTKFKTSSSSFCSELSAYTMLHIKAVYKANEANVRAIKLMYVRVLRNVCESRIIRLVAI